MIYDYYKERKGELFIYNSNLYFIEYPLLHNVEGQLYSSVVGHLYSPPPKSAYPIH